MSWSFRPAFRSLSIRGYVLVWVGCIFISCVALGSAWLATELRLRRIGAQRELEIESLDGARRLESCVLDEGREFLLWRTTGDENYKAERDKDLLAAMSITDSLLKYGPTQNDLRVIAEIRREIEILSKANKSMTIPAPEELQMAQAELRDAVREYIALQDGDMAELNRLAQRMHTAETWSWGALIVLVAVLLASGSLGLIVRVVRPVADLTRAAERFGEGDYSVRAPVVREDEIGVLSRTLNDMADSIARHIEQRRHVEEEILEARDELEQRVKTEPRNWPRLTRRCRRKFWNAPARSRPCGIAKKPSAHY